jgi:predicted nucleic acid-binding protein
MASASKWLLDTNVLQRIARESDPLHRMLANALRKLEAEQVEFCFCMQNIAEFWNVFTRPAINNGFGLSTSDTQERVELIERTMTFLPDNEQVYSIWRALVATHHIGGVKVHDAHLVATMRANGLVQILTINQPDFSRFAGVRAVHPRDLQPATQ